MEILIASKHLLAEVSTAFDVRGQEYLVVVAKASWQIPQAGQRAYPIAPQALAMADIFVGEAGQSAMLYGEDFVRYKAQCDVLWHAHAHSAQPVPHMQAGWRVGTLQKVLQVHGPRQWEDAGQTIGQANLFTRMPLHYGFAFGGTRAFESGGDALCEAFADNPDGCGWAGPHTMQQLVGQAAPNLEAVNAPVQRADGPYQAMAFSALAKHYLARRQYGGTYDEQWQKEVFPFLPDDFDERFYQCAPLDQQIPYPRGGEQVLLWNLMAKRPLVEFNLPRLDHLRLRILRSDYSIEEPQMVVDTLYFEPDEERFSAVWRCSVPIRRKIQEFTTLAFGHVNSQWWEDKTTGVADCINCSNDDADEDEPESAP